MPELTPSQVRRLKESAQDMGAEVREVVALVRALASQIDTMQNAALRLAADVHEVTSDG